MKALNVLNEESIKLLNSNKLLKPLIQSEYVKQLLQEVKIEKELSEKITSEFLKKYNLNDKKDYHKWLESNSLTELEVKNLALSDVRLKRYCKENFQHKVESRFLERKNQLDIFVYSLIRVKDYFTANELYLRIIENEEDIGNLASRFSIGPERKTRGVVGPVSLEITHPILAEQLKNCSPGEVKPPFSFENLFLVCRLECREPAKLDEVMREKMSLELFNKWLEDQTQELNNQFINNLNNRNIEGDS